MRALNSEWRNRGFTLLETMIALVVLGVGILGLAAMLATSLAYMNSAQADFIAQQKAGEAIESIFTARDDQAVSWAQIQNVSAGGVFLNGAAKLCDPGVDGIVDTADDNLAQLDSIIKPGPDGILGTADDIVIPISDFYQMTRTITISNIVNEPSVRQIVITINYQAGRFSRKYTLTSYISQYS
ncbi:MAG: prepilin-type N-terminal cleavage/methylation domain-containing protein [Candidatus Acidiferrales bacterium]